MNLSISNFAWDFEENQKMFNHLKKCDINHIELIFTKVDSWDKLNPNKILDLKSLFDENSINPYSIQSLFYNVSCQSLCDVDCITNHFIKLIEYSKLLNVKIMVLGSPKLRKNETNLDQKLKDTFIELDNLLIGSGINVLIEPNSKIYGGDYFFTLNEIIKFIEKHKLRNIKTMIDTHNSILENRNPIIELVDFFDYIEHIHVSEIDLKPIVINDFHIQFSNKLKEMKYNKTITYEVIKTDDIFFSIDTFSKLYK